MRNTKENILVVALIFISFMIIYPAYGQDEGGPADITGVFQDNINLLSSAVDPTLPIEIDAFKAVAIQVTNNNNTQGQVAIDYTCELTRFQGQQPVQETPITCPKESFDRTFTVTIPGDLLKVQTEFKFEVVANTISSLQKTQEFAGSDRVFLTTGSAEDVFGSFEGSTPVAPGTVQEKTDFEKLMQDNIRNPPFNSCPIIGKNDATGNDPIWLNLDKIEYIITGNGDFHDLVGKDSIENFIFEVTVNFPQNVLKGKIQVDYKSGKYTILDSIGDIHVDTNCIYLPAKGTSVPEYITLSDRPIYKQVLDSNPPFKPCDEKEISDGIYRFITEEDDNSFNSVVFDKNKERDFEFKVVQDFSDTEIKKYANFEVEGKDKIYNIDLDVHESKFIETNCIGFPPGPQRTEGT